MGLGPFFLEIWMYVCRGWGLGGVFSPLPQIPLLLCPAFSVAFSGPGFVLQQMCIKQPHLYHLPLIFNWALLDLRAQLYGRHAPCLGRSSSRTRWPPKAVAWRTSLCIPVLILLVRFMSPHGELLDRIHVFHPCGVSGSEALSSMCLTNIRFLCHLLTMFLSPFDK